MGTPGGIPGIDAQFAEKLSAAQSSTADTASQLTTQLQSTLTDLTSTAVTRSKDLYTGASAAVGDKVPSIEELSSQFTEQLSFASGAASSVSSDLLARSSEFQSQAAGVLSENLSVLTERLSSSADPAQFAGQFADLSDKVLSLTSELTSKSSDASTQFTSALEKQLPELEAQFSAGADAFLRNVNSATSQASGLLNSDLLNGVSDKFEDKVDVIRGLVSSGQVADVLATPEGIGAAAIATAGVLFSVTSTVSSKNLSSKDPSNQAVMAVSTSREAASDAVSARAWIDQWRSSQVPLSQCHPPVDSTACDNHLESS